MRRWNWSKFSSPIEVNTCLTWGKVSLLSLNSRLLILTTFVRFKMLSTNYKFSGGVALCNLNDIGTSTFVQDFADFAVKSPMRQSLLLGRVNLDDNTVFGFVLVQELGKLWFSFRSERFPHEAAGTRTIAF